MSVENQMMDLLKGELKANLNSILSDSEIKTIDDIKTVSNWYQEAGKGKKAFF